MSVHNIRHTLTTHCVARPHLHFVGKRVCCWQLRWNDEVKLSFLERKEQQSGNLNSDRPLVWQKFERHKPFIMSDKCRRATVCINFSSNLKRYAFLMKMHLHIYMHKWGPVHTICGLLTDTDRTMTTQLTIYLPLAKWKAIDWHWLLIE